jgi:hypothetical protein
MNIKKIAGLLCWLLASFVFLVFLGYWLVDSSAAKSESHGH